MKKKKTPRLKDLIKDEELRKQIQEALYSDKPLLGPEGGIFTQLLQAMVNASLEGELDHHLETEKEEKQSNRRNGYTNKTVKSQAGDLSIQTPRDRSSKFDPKLVAKRQRELKGGLEQAILALYAQGNSNEDIKRMLQKMYGIDYPSTSISRITDRVWPEINAWQQRALKSCYAVLYLDGMYFRVRQDGQFSGKTLYTVYGIDPEGNRDLLGLYISNPESAPEWLLVLEDLKKRGVEDVMLVCIDGLPGFKKVIHAVFPDAVIQRCIVHKVRNSVRFLPDKKYRPVCVDLRKIYTSANREQAAQALDEFEQKWGQTGQRIAELWRKDWDELMAFMDFSEDLRRLIYTTNPVENVHRVIRKIVKSKAAWTSDRALTKQLYLALMQNEKSWKRKAFKWKTIQEQLVLRFGDRFAKWLDL